MIIKQNQANQDEKEKMRLELIFARELKSLFARMNKENAQSIAATGTPLNAEKFNSEWEALLRKHISRTQESFKGSVEITLPKEDQGFSKEEIALMALALIRWRDGKAKRSANLITDTNNAKINDAIKRSRELLQEQDQPTDNLTLAATTSALLKRSNNARVKNIAITETQAAAESTKLIEAETLSGLTPGQDFRPLVQTIESQKIWITVGDDRVRSTHQATNGTEKQIDQLFTVGGQLLENPGDSSHGATLKEIANCRCALTFEITRVRK